LSSRQIPDAEAVLDQVIGAVRDCGISAEELARAKSAMVARNVFVRDDLLALARLYGEAVAAGRTMTDVDDLPTRLEKVSAADILRVAQGFLAPANSVTGTLIPTDEPKGSTARVAKP
jgi:zinc protease